MPLKENKLTETEQKLFNFMSEKHPDINVYNIEENITDPDDFASCVGINYSEIDDIIGDVRFPHILLSSSINKDSENMMLIANHLNHGPILIVDYDVYGGIALREVLYINKGVLKSTQNTKTKEQRKLVAKFLKNVYKQ